MLFSTFEEIEAGQEEDDSSFSIFPNKPEEGLIPASQFGHDLKCFTPISARLALAASARDYVQGWFSFYFKSCGNFTSWRLSDTSASQKFYDGHPCARMKVGGVYQYASLYNNKKTNVMKITSIDKDMGMIKVETPIDEPAIILNEYAGDIEMTKRDWVLERLAQRYNYKDQLLTLVFNQLKLEGGLPNYNSKFSYHQGVVGGGKSRMLVQQLSTRLLDEGLGMGTLFIVSSETNKSLKNVSDMLTEKNIRCVQFTNEDTDVSWHKLFKEEDSYKNYMMLKASKPPQHSNDLILYYEKKSVAKRQLFSLFSTQVLLVTPSKLIDFYRMFKPDHQVNFYIDEAGLMKLKNFFPFLLYNLKKLFLYGDHKQFMPYDEDDSVKNVVYYKPYKEIMEKLSTSVADWFTAMNIPHISHNTCWRLPDFQAKPLVAFHYNSKSEQAMARFEQSTLFDFKDQTLRTDKVYLPMDLKSYPYMPYTAKEKEAARMVKFLEALSSMIEKGLKEYKKWKITISKDASKIKDVVVSNPCVVYPLKNLKNIDLLSKKTTAYYDAKLNQGIFKSVDYESYKELRVISPYTHIVSSLKELYDKFYENRLLSMNVRFTFQTARKTQSEGHDYVCVYWPKRVSEFIDDRMLLVSYSRHRKWMIHTKLDFSNLLPSTLIYWFVKMNYACLGIENDIKKKKAILRRDGLYWEGVDRDAVKFNLKLTQKGFPEILTFTVLDQDKLRHFFLSGLYDRFMEYLRIVSYKQNRLQDVHYVNSRTLNSASDLLVIEDSMSNFKYPLLSDVEASYKYGLYLMSHMTDKLTFKVFIPGIKVKDRRILYLSSDGIYSYENSFFSLRLKSPD